MFENDDIDELYDQKQPKLEVVLVIIILLVGFLLGLSVGACCG